MFSILSFVPGFWLKSDIRTTSDVCKLRKIKDKIMKI